MKQNKQNDADLKALFSAELELPDSLSKENVKDMIRSHNVRQFKKKRHVLPKVIAAAAAVAIVVTSVSLLPPVHRNVSTVTVDEPTSTQLEPANAPQPVRTLKAPVLSRFESDSDLKAYFGNLYQDEAAVRRKGIFFNGAVDKAADFAAEADNAYAVPQAEYNTARSVTAASAENAATGNYGQTNSRDEAVDEADILKNDGRYLYIANGDSLTIIDTQTMQKCSVLQPQPKDADSSYQFREAYVLNDRLVLTATEHRGYDRSDMKRGYSYDRIAWYEVSDTVQFIYDITDKANPVLLRELKQSGDLLQTRIIGHVLYTVTQYNVNIYSKEAVEKNYAPAVDGKTLTSDEILIRDKAAEDTSYLVLSAFDVTQKDAEASRFSVLGYSNEMYCSSDTLYLLSTDWGVSGDDGNCRTNIYAFALNGTKVELKATGAVPGEAGNDYAIDQLGGYLRITTTDYNYKTDLDVSSLYVLNSQLKIVGELTDFAPDEQVKSTRFLGDLAYVVTFRNTDPLFAIDLRDPAKPAILGKVKLPGFSAYLHPLTSTLLLGVGYHGDDKNADYDSVKLSLFDISDPTHPKETDSHVIKQAGTDVAFEPKAFVFDAQRGAFGIPVTYSLFDKDDCWVGTKAVFRWFTVDGNRFGEQKAFVHGTENGKYYYTLSNLFRGTYIGDRIYTVSDTQVLEFSMETEQRTRELQYAEREEVPDVTVVDYAVTNPADEAKTAVAPAESGLTDPIVFNGAIVPEE